MDATVIAGMLGASIRVATPLAYGALGGILSERSGTFAVGIEGMMLSGAFGGAVTTLLTGDLALGIAASILGGMVTAAIVGVATVRFRADQMVTGLAVNILALGLTSFLLRGLFHGHAPVMRLARLGPMPIPVLADLPFLGPVFFRQPFLTDLAVVLMVVLHVVLTRTRPGLALRAAGENPEAVFAAGGNPQRLRLVGIVVGGGIAGLGGAVLSLQEVGTFTDGMTSGRGFMALAAIIVGRWSPFGAVLACLLFGAATAFELHLQGIGLPVSSYVIQMAPYGLALAILAGLGRGTRMPGAIGRPFTTG
jgi:general nucleoside transport system permease protein